MAEEFAEFMENLNHKSMGDQLVELKSVVINLVDLVQKFINSYTTELEVIHNKIISLETKPIQCETPDVTEPIQSEIPDLAKLTPPAGLNPPRVVGRESVRGMLMGELKHLFKKRNGLEE